MASPIETLKEECEDMKTWLERPLPLSKEPIVHEIAKRMLPKLDAVLKAVLHLEMLIDSTKCTEKRCDT